MIKYCAKCGKPLPEGVEICPECNTAAQESEAALFTRMTSETEVWKAAEPVKPRKRKIRKPRSSRKNLAIYCGAGLLVAVAVFAILFSQPSARVARAIRGGEFDRASEIYWSSTSLAGGTRVARIDKAIMEAAEKLCTQYARHEIDGDTAASELAKLGTFGDGAADMLEDTYAEFRTFSSSQEHKQQADKLFRNGEFLDAREEYLLVVESDADYAEAQTKAGECLSSYGESVGKEAELYMKDNDYRGAIAVLKEGNAALAEFDTFSEVIDSKLLECYGLYESFLLTEAKNLAELKDYDAAVTTLRESIDDFGSDNTRLQEALDSYVALALEKQLSDADQRANTFYEQGSYAEAFHELETVRNLSEENSEAADAMIAALEKRFAADMCAAAETSFGGAREKLVDAIGGLDAALEIRPLEDIQSYRDHLAKYLPLSLVEAEYSDKSGTVFRSTGTFESLDGQVIEDGWVWGENGSEISFALDGAYDEFTCCFAVRRDDNANANGHFELWCDGEKTYHSETLYHFQKKPQQISVVVTGCKELKLVFVCDYKVSTAENGYCYHGICSPTLTKNMDDA